MKIVLVSQRVVRYPDRNEVRDELDQRLVTFLLASGYIPFPVPNVLCISRFQNGVEGLALSDWLSVFNPHAILLSGGNDIFESIDRDKTEISLLDYARDRQLPVLGICRGMQMIGVWSGASLRKVNGHVGTRHTLYGQINKQVNSYHDFVLDSCPREFYITALSDDCSIEAIRHNVLPWEGWMWHPERELTFDQDDIDRIRKLFE